MRPETGGMHSTRAAGSTKPGKRTRQRTCLNAVIKVKKRSTRSPTLSCPGPRYQSAGMASLCHHHLHSQRKKGSAFPHPPLPLSRSPSTTHDTMHTKNREFISAQKAHIAMRMANKMATIQFTRLSIRPMRWVREALSERDTT